MYISWCFQVTQAGIRCEDKMPGNIMPVVSKQEVGVANPQSEREILKKWKHEHIDIEQKKKYSVY